MMAISNRDTRHTNQEDRSRDMDSKQMLLFVLVLIPVCAHQCFQEKELQGAAERRLRNHFQQPLDPDLTESLSGQQATAPCPVELYKRTRPADEASRSLSPWRYVIRTNPDYFPSSYSEAECLCRGCILIENCPDSNKGLVLSDDYNSLPVKQSKIFLKKEPCENGEGYRLKPVAVDVTVGCHCARTN